MNTANLLINELIGTTIPMNDFMSLSQKMLLRNDTPCSSIRPATTNSDAPSSSSIREVISDIPDPVEDSSIETVEPRVTVIDDVIAVENVDGVVVAEDEVILI